MKTDTHPTYFPDAKITCTCGNVIHTGATKKEMHIEICGACHPFYTGKEKLVDTAGRVEKFKAKVAKAQAVRTKAQSDRAKTKKTTLKKAVEKKTRK